MKSKDYPNTKSLQGIENYLFSIIGELTKEQKIQLLTLLDRVQRANDKRKYPRFPFFVQVMYNYQGIHSEDFIKDISPGGMFLETDKQLSLGARIKITIAIPGFDEPLVVEGEVVRQNKNGVGVKFLRPLAIFDMLSPYSTRLLPSKFRPLDRIKFIANQKLPGPLFEKIINFNNLIRVILRRVLQKGNTSHEILCNICNKKINNFLPIIMPPRPRLSCPNCGALERHRLDWLFLERKTNLLDGSHKRLLHVAPERVLKEKFAKLNYIEYISIDLKQFGVMVTADVTRLPFRDNSFDVIYCSHVLEHVPDDRAAMAELFRVLRPSGWGLIQVPISSKRTFEDFTITNPIDRARVFGRYDHVRRYGLDYADRLREAGFKVTVFSPKEILGAEYEQKKMYFQDFRRVFYCQKG